jgi:RHS repeat-associated protein
MSQSGGSNNACYTSYREYLGSVIYATGDGGGVIADQRYYPYGRKRSGGTLPTDHRFTGQQYSEANGLYYFNARYYDPDLPDSTNVFDYNRYMYTRGNPLKYTDPTGHCLTEGQPGWDTSENQQCLGLVSYIYNVLQSNPSWAANWLPSVRQTTGVTTPAIRRS